MAEQTSATESRNAEESLRSTVQPITDYTSIGEPRRSVEGTDDNGGEKPVREKLKNTTIDTLSQTTQSMPSTQDVDVTAQVPDEASEPPVTSQVARGRPLRKRSFDDLQSEDTIGANTEIPEKQHSHHKRMRSRGANDDIRVEDEDEGETSDPTAPGPGADPIPRPSTPSPEPIAADVQAASTLLSPQKKRRHDQVDFETNSRQETSEGSDDSYVHVTADDVAVKVPESIKGTPGKGEPEKKRTRDGAQGLVDSKTRGSGFSNTSAVSPFGSLPTKEKESIHPSVEAREQDEGESKETSASAFASSGISAFSRSEGSPFGTLGSTTKPSGFGSSTTNGKSGFGFGGSSSASQASPFASSGSGGISGLTSTASSFGGSKLGGGFGSAFGAARPLGGGLSSFASPAGKPGIIGASSGPVKAFGAPEDEDDDENEEEGSGDSESEANVEEKSKDKRFVEQEVETGEENEETIFSCRAKLFHFDKEWKERGLGTFKLNVNGAYELGGESKARFIMRTEGVHRVILNTPVYKDMKVGNNEGKEPSGKHVNLSAMENGKFVPLLLKAGSHELTKDLYHKVKEVQEQLQSP